MNRKMMALTAGLLTLTMVAGVNVALAQENSRDTNIAVVDVQYLMQHSVAAKSARAQIEKMRANYQQEIKGKLEGITRYYEKIAQERPTLSEDAYHQRLLGLRQKAENYQSDAQERHGKLDSSLNEALQKIVNEIELVVDQIMKEQKLAVVLPESVIIGTPAVPDITQEVLRRLNQRIPSVVTDLPK